MSGDEETKKPDKGGKSPMPISEVQSLLKSSIKTGVEKTNKALAGLEESSEKIGHPVVEALKSVKHEGEIAAHHIGSLYESRKEYGPQIIVGSSLLVGGIFGLRRGRVPAVVSGAATGLFTYVGVYEFEMHKIPQIIFGRENE
jgi:hypothetical protein